MRKSKRPPAPATFVYLRDVLPELAKALRADLRRIGERTLAEQVMDVKIYGRCCNASPCGAFYCVPRDERRELHRKRLTRTVSLEYVVAKDGFVEILTVSPEVDAVLRQVFPEPEGGDHVA